MKKFLEARGFKIQKVNTVVGSILGTKDMVWACFKPGDELALAANKLQDLCLKEAVTKIQSQEKSQ